MSEKKGSKRTPFENAFPKSCGVCGKNYLNHNEFLNKTSPLSAGELSQGPKESVLSYRNCSCGSTITIKVEDLRDYSEAGVKQREEFKKRLLEQLEKGIDSESAIKLVKKEMDID